ncbi:MAG: type VI secretion system membrane subunit TssM [Gammaproteobacteria bacterium]|nr:type VI secretion system membrane subunit TssM [Gammaproteobacteria bacterium]MDH5802700.1 type VI secretion system membrane subunit TssM [Gammaproteobacteria bacterium]
MIRWAFIIAGLLALSLLIWFGGPMVAINEYVPLKSVTARLLTIVIIIMTWAIVQLLKQIKAKQDNEGLIAGLESSTQEAGEDSAFGSEDVSMLQRNFNEALGVLRKTKHQGGQGEEKLNELPWYIIIGPPGSGKTTAIANSGLRFPLGDRFGNQALRGVGGTRDCDFWFTDEAVLVDTAGRYTTQDSHAETDRAGWDGFLGLLKKHRKRRPINGVMIGISLAELMQQNESERLHHATTIKHRIQELNQKLGIKFPVYVLFTKTDLVAGFNEFFEDMGRDDRSQVWGITFPMDAASAREGVVKHFSGEFDTLIARINSRVLPRMNQERDLQRRNMIHSFPHQMASLKQTADSFLQEIFRPSRYESPFLLRGVYFTSGTQEGTPIDRIMGSLASIFGIDRTAAPHFSGQGRSYFITNLFKQVIFPEAGVAGTDQRLEKQRAWLLRAAYAGAVIITMAATLTWTGSYSANSAHINRVSENLNNYLAMAQQSKTSRDVAAILPELHSLNQARTVYANSGLTWLSSLGLNKRSSVEPAADEAYRRVLVSDFLPRLANRLEEQLVTRGANSEYLHGALKAYLMLYDTKNLDPEFFKLWVNLDWQNSNPGDKTRQQQLGDHMNALFENGFNPIKVNPTLIAKTRNVLRRIPLAERVYTRLKQEAAANDTLAINIAGIVSGPGQSPFSLKNGDDTVKNIPSLFTYKGFHDVYMSEGMEIATETTDENWVLGSREQHDVDPAELNKQVQKLYLADYIQTWDALINNLQIAKFKNIDHAIDNLELLSGPQSPIVGILKTLDTNTSLNRLPDNPEANAAAGAATALSSKAKRVASVMKKVQGVNLSKLVKGPGLKVQNTFEPVNKLVQSKGSIPPPINDVLAQVGEVHNFMLDIAAGSRGSAALQAAAKRMSGGSGDAIGRLRLKASRLEEPVRSWMLSIADHSWRVVLNSAHAHINNIWEADIVPNFNRGLKNRYPLRKTSTEEISLTDFSKFFGPDGDLDTFYKRYLSPFVNVTRRGWSLRSFENQTLGLSRSALNSLENAYIIKNTFFADGSPLPSVSFKLKPTYLDGNIVQFSLNIDGQQLVYKHDPQRFKNLKWPGPDGPSRVRMSFKASSGSHISRTKDGPWGFFRVLDQSEVTKTALNDQYKVTFEINGHKAKYELRADSVVNPFRLGALESFSCPTRL